MGNKRLLQIDFLPEGQSLNSEYFVENVIIPLFEKKKVNLVGMGKKKNMITFR